MITSELNEILKPLGNEIRLGGNQPISLADGQHIWLVQAGKVDVFYVTTCEGETIGARQHIFRALPGDILIGMEFNSEINGIGLIAAGVPGTQLLSIKKNDFQAVCRDRNYGQEFADLIEQWIVNISNGLIVDRPRTIDCPISIGGSVAVKAGRTVGAESGVVWIAQPAGITHILANESLPSLTDKSCFPLTELLWVKAINDLAVNGIPTSEHIKTAGFWTDLEQFHRVSLAVILDKIKSTTELDNRRAGERKQQNQQVFHAALTRFSQLLEKTKSPIVSDRSDPLFSACQIIGHRQGIVFRRPAEKLQISLSNEPLKAIVNASRVRTRNVLLRDQWWNQDHGPLLTYFQEDKRPAALLPLPRRGYELHDVVNDRILRVDSTIAASLEPIGQVIYRSFPERALTIRDIISFATWGCRRDLGLIAIVGIMSALLGIVIPMATGKIFDTIIPSSDRFMLLQMTIALVVCTVASWLFTITSGLTTIRLSAKSEMETQSAIWDRLLNLPIPFFRQYTSGDLSERAMGIEQIRKVLSGTTMSTMFAGMFSFGNYLLLYYYSVDLAMKATGLVIIALLVSTMITVLQIAEQRKLMKIEGKLTGVVFQLIGGISKFRIAGGETRAFAYWSKLFADKKKIAYRNVELRNHFNVFNSIYPVIASMCIFYLVVKSLEKAPGAGETPMSIGDFLAFNTAFATFLTGVLTVVNSLLGAANVIPLYERAKPILETVPEIDEGKADPGALTGRVEINHIMFRYERDGPAILNDVSFQILPGEFVAIVGASGSGKSTMLRLLLGFEMPESGAIFYDGQELDSIDIRSVRQQIGVVLQNGRILPGNIFKNIVGSSPLTIEDAWAAAEMVGFANDVRAMPMGMHTMITEGGSTLSGGQRQRLMIARALVKRPRLLYFDEATSALDNQTQQIVSKSIEKLNVSRLVIAHRLSTIINADKIIVLDHGTIKEVGNYRALMNNNGAFAELARRQIA